MFKINLSPQVREDSLTVSKHGETLVINGIDYDFSQLPEGATLPREAIDCEYIVSDVGRLNGNIELTLLLPITADASYAAKFPVPILVPEDGPVVLPE
ncbi:hypothetical protein [Cloacibacillus porcorum]|uniref:hypothetical protein n=1 Tax=Cloacibacillus porcorum TaxID=1197717 RepID=UPI003D061090